MNKLLIILGILSIAATYNKPCDQGMYDILYKSILEQALKENNITKRNNSIRTLRYLCKEQISTLEYLNSKKYQLKDKK